MDTTTTFVHLTLADGRKIALRRDYIRGYHENEDTRTRTVLYDRVDITQTTIVSDTYAELCNKIEGDNIPCAEEFH